MTTFTQAVQNQSARTENGMAAFKSTTSPLVDFFFKAGASRGKDIIPTFVAAYVEDPDLTLRITQWMRDARGGAGERELFRSVLRYLEQNNPVDAIRLLNKIPEIGRFDDAFVFQTEQLRNAGFELVAQALKDGNGLAGKWSPRINSAKKHIAIAFQKYLGLTPRQYRKMLAELTKVVETNMCQNDWDNINFSHVPSVAASRYKKAFNRHTPKYAEYVAALKAGDPTVKVNSGAVYPYDVLKGVMHSRYDQTELDHIVAQWDALENFISDANILPLVDVSGSMSCLAGGYRSKSGVTCLDVAVSLGLYCADKNTGAFNGTFLTFSGKPELIHLKGNIVQKAQQMIRSHWEMNTNLHAALNKVLSVAKEGNVLQEDMPDMLLVLSDMQMDFCTQFDDTAYQMIQRKYAESGYICPQIVFWNLNAYDNVPVQAHESGVALVSGFSPAILRAVLAANLEEFTPWNIMYRTVMISRYDI